jgi:hypothetical protein
MKHNGRAVAIIEAWPGALSQGTLSLFDRPCGK